MQLKAAQSREAQAGRASRIGNARDSLSEIINRGLGAEDKSTLLGSNRKARSTATSTRAVRSDPRALYPRAREAEFFGAPDGRASINFRVLYQLIKAWDVMSTRPHVPSPSRTLPGHRISHGQGPFWALLERRVNITSDALIS